jgi:hypothetical protein
MYFCFHNRWQEVLRWLEFLQKGLPAQPVPTLRLIPRDPKEWFQWYQDTVTFLGAGDEWAQGIVNQWVSGSLEFPETWDPKGAYLLRQRLSYAQAIVTPLSDHSYPGGYTDPLFPTPSISDDHWHHRTRQWALVHLWENHGRKAWYLRMLTDMLAAQASL